MIVVDSSALVAIFRREPDASELDKRIVRAGGSLLSAVGLLETSMVLAGSTGDVSFWTGLDAFIVRAKIQVVAHDAELALAAREAFLRYGKGRHRAALNMGDCAAYALAKTRNLPLLFKGQDFTRTDLTQAA